MSGKSSLNYATSGALGALEGEADVAPEAGRRK
jgi:hypothetical protein